MRGFASQTKPDLGSGHFPSKEQHVDAAAGVLGESIARTWSCRADFHHLLLCCCAQHLLASLCRHPTTETGQPWDTGPVLATALLPLPTQVLENQWKKGLVGTVSKNLHLLCRRTFPDLSLLHRGLITAQNSLYQSHHCGLSSGCSRVPEQRMLPADKGGRISTC